MLCGPAGAGKSTFARSVVQDNRLPTTVAVSSDVCRLTLCDKLDTVPEGDWTLLQENTFHLFLTVVESRLRLGRPTLADGVNLHRELREGLLTSARKHGYRSALVVFDLSLDTCLAQNERREPACRIPERLIRIQRQALDDLLPYLCEEGWDRIEVLSERRRTMLMKMGPENASSSY